MSLQFTEFTEFTEFTDSPVPRTATLARAVALSITLACGALPALAGGNHAGGHEHGDTAIGVPGQAERVTRTVSVDMNDAMRFTPSRISVRKGETVRFVISNSGQVKHEFVLGSAQALKAHDALMKKFPEMEHDEPNMVSVEPGKTGSVVWQFTTAGAVDFACLQPGHFDAGMKGRVNVTGSANDGRARLPTRPASQAAR